jgi:hypothetical protein
MSGHTCLNCGHIITEKYCGNCGQKAATHRFDLRHFFEHDIVHGVFHLDKGFPFTIKQMFSRPGFAVREYIEGKRISYFNPVTFLLLVIALNIFVITVSGFRYSDLMPAPDTTGTLDKVQHFQTKYMKQMYLVTIPMLSLCSFLIIRRGKQNYAEHLVLNTYKESASLLINTIFYLIMGLVKNAAFNQVFAGLLGLLTITYSLVFYLQYFKKDYEGKKGLLVFSIISTMLLASILETTLVMFFFFSELFK